MRKAWVENGRVRDICRDNPEECYHPNIAIFYSESVPDDAENGDGWDGIILTKPLTPEPVVVEPTIAELPKVSPVEFKLLFTSAERVAIREARKTDPILDDFYDIVEDPRLTIVDFSLASVQGALDYLTITNLIAENRKAEILTGVMVKA